MRNITIPTNLLNHLQSFKQSNIDDFESCGVIMGIINDDGFIITHIIEAKYKHRLREYVEMDIDYINERISDIWEQSEGLITYLGDWHTHPEDVPTPSNLDIKTAIGNYEDIKEYSDLMIYVIVGRNDNFFKAFDGTKFNDIRLICE